MSSVSVSMPIGFRDDPDDSKYRVAYFERQPGACCHDDCAQLTERDGAIIYGRSDATLNQGGLRSANPNYLLLL